MAYVLVQHKVAKWSDFESIFRDDGERRRMLGSKGGKVFRSAQDPESVFVLFEWDTLEGANKFADGLETHEAMEWATSGTWSRIFVMDELFDVEA
jgi:heme-degrading monooxygenase HmoA